MFAALYAPEGTPPNALADVAREFSPRLEVHGPREAALDLSGLSRLFGDARTIAEEIRRAAADRGLQVRVAIAGTRAAARLLVHHRAGVTVVAAGTEAAALAGLPLALLGVLDINAQRPTPNASAFAPEDPGLGVVFRRWGLRTLGDLAALPSDDVAARLGQAGVWWQRLARGEDAAPLVPAVPEERFAQSIDLEWPIEELEPLSFVLGRLMEPLSAHLERRGRGAAVLHVRLSLVKAAGEAREVHERSLQLPTPIRDARTLRTLALLDLESHPPAGPIERVEVAVAPTPGRIVQFSLITRPLPSPERLSTLMARLQALMGETRCGSPALVDTWRPGAFEMRPFAPTDSPKDFRVSASPRPVDVNVALRRFRHPVPVRVRIADGKPAHVAIDRRGMSGGAVHVCAGPWRTSGDWWADAGRARPSGRAGGASEIAAWDRDEWDVTLTGGVTYRLFRARDIERWFVDGMVD